MCRRESTRARSASGDIFQSGHGTPERRQAAGTLPFDEGFKSFTNQRSLFLHSSKFLGNADEVVVQGECCSHKEYALIIASYDAYFGVYFGPLSVGHAIIARRMALISGTKLGPYEIIAPLGAGGMGEVYRAKDTRLDRTVAIKVLPSHLSSDPELKQRMEREARAISALQHVNICTLHDIGAQDGTDFLVMEYLEGQTLAARLEKGALPLDQVLKVGTEIAQALEKAHQQGIIHRDLKPANIMLTKAGAKLMDFGLAKPEVPTASRIAGPLTPSTPTMNLASLTSAASPLTQKGSIVGTFQYIAPEVLQGAEADARSDLFSFGCVLYEMITGRRAFEGKSQLSVFTAILEKDPESISVLQPLSPPMLESIVLACLAKDPDDRIQSAHDLAMDSAGSTITRRANQQSLRSSTNPGRLL